MARNKINFAAQGLYVGPSPATGLHFDGTGCGTLSGDRGETLVKELYRIQGVDYSFDFGKENISAFGDLAPIDYAITTAPVVNLNFSYLCSNFLNEKNLGFVISSGGLVNALSGIISTEEDRNFFLAIHGTDGEDLHNNPNYNYDSQGSIIGIGNGIINNYSFNVAVGQSPTVNVGVEALNMQVYDKQSSLYTTLMENAGKNGNFDIVNTGGALFKSDYFQDWDIDYNDTANVKIVPDPVNISNAINQDLMIIARPSGNAYFTSSTTGATDWVSAGLNAASGYVFINTGTQQLVLRKLGQSASQYYYLTNANNGFNPPTSTGTWYKLVCDLASSPDVAFDLRFGGSNEIIGYPKTGINTFYLFSTGANNGGLLATTASISGDYIFNSIELFIPQNYSVRFYCTGGSEPSYNHIWKDTNTSIYNLLNSSNGNNKRYNLSFDLKYSGFSSIAYGPTDYKSFCYFRMGEQTNDNVAGGRFPRFDTSYSGQFNRVELEFSNSTSLNQSTIVKSLFIVRLFNQSDGEFWVDNVKLEQTNKTDIINGNLFGGSFEIYHPSYVGSGNGVIAAFSGLRFAQDSSYSAYCLITGSTLLPSIDTTKSTTAQSANIKLINKTGTASRYVTIVPELTMPMSKVYEANKRHKFTCYTRYSGTANAFNFKLTEAWNYNYYSEVLDNSNSYEYKEIEFIPTGSTIPKIELTFNTLAQNGDQVWLDDMNLYYYDDCYELPVVQDVSGGFGLPINPTTNYSGLSTNANLKSLSVLSPKDTYLNINYSDLGVNVTGWKLQSINLDLPLNRERIYKIDQLFPDYRLLFPIQGNISLNAITTDLVTGDLYNYYFNCNKNYDLTFGIQSPCNDDQGINFIVKKAKLNGLSFSNPINGKGQEVTMDFIYTIPSPSATTQGLFLSGITDLS